MAATIIYHTSNTRQILVKVSIHGLKGLIKDGQYIDALIGEHVYTVVNALDVRRSRSSS